MIDHDELNRRFVALDTEPALLKARFGCWLAWPIVKERLWLLCRNKWHEEKPGPRAGENLSRLGYGVRQVLRGLLSFQRRRTAVLYKPRMVTVPHGGAIDPFIGDLKALESTTSVFYYAFGLVDRGRSAHTADLLDYHGIGAVMAAAARLYRRSPAVNTLTAEISAPVRRALPEVPGAELEAAVRDELARFHCRRIFTRMALKRRGVRNMIVFDPDGKVPEVAAAKELGISVIEVQHGMFCNKEPEYSWTSVHRKMATEMPVPDRVLVFGLLWKQQLLDAGYWRDEDVIEAVNPVVAAYRPIVRSRAERSAGGKLVVLYPTQEYVRATALTFWTEVLEKLRENGVTAFQLRIKLHPDERNDRRAYSTLFEAFPDLCTLVPDGRDTFEEMVEADAVAGYSSLMLMEALGLGLPVFSLSGGAAGEGFASIFGMPELSEVFCEVDTPSRMVELLSGGIGSAFLHELKSRSRKNAHIAYCHDAEPVEVMLKRICGDD